MTEPQKMIIDDVDNNAQEFLTVDQLADNQSLINCYQMQLDENNICRPVYLGKYPDIPLPVNKVMKYKKYLLYVVTYVLSEQEIADKLFKIVGVNVIRQNRKSSIYSLDLVMNDELKNYQLLFNDHVANKTVVVENIEKLPEKDQILEYILQKSFEEPLKSKLLE
jgi:hypothetical protein